MPNSITFGVNRKRFIKVQYSLPHIRSRILIVVFFPTFLNVRSMDDENNNTTELSCMDNEVNDTAEFLYVDNGTGN